MKLIAQILTGLALAGLFSGCCITRATYNGHDGTTASVTNYRLLWSTDNYALNYGTNGVAFNAVKSNTDKEALGAVVSAAVQAGVGAATKP